MSGSTGAAWTVLARRLRELPVTAAAVRDGRFTFDQARAVTSCLDADLLPAFREDEQTLVPILAGLSVDDIRRAMAEWAARVRAVLDDKPLVDERRGLFLSQLGDEWVLDATFTPEGGELVDRAIAEATSKDGEGEPVRTTSQKRADALVDVCRWFLDHQKAPPKTRRRPHLDLAAGVDDLAHDGPARTSSGMILDPATLSRLACDAMISPFLVSAGRTSCTTACRSAPCPPPCSSRSSCGTGTAAGPAATAPPTGATATTSTTGPRAGPPTSTTSPSSAPATTTSPTSPAGT